MMPVQLSQPAKQNVIEVVLRKVVYPDYASGRVGFCGAVQYRRFDESRKKE